MTEISQDKIEEINAYSSWIKLFSILNYIGSLVIVGVGVYQVVSGDTVQKFAGVTNVLFGGVSWWQTTKLFNAAKQYKSINTDNLTEKSYKGMDLIGQFFKIAGVVLLVNIAATILIYLTFGPEVTKQFRDASSF
jgi:hypothetical protein